MEPRSRETTPTKKDLDFIVDDGYKHDEDPDYVPNEKYVVTGAEFKRLTRNAKKLGAESLDYSTRKNNKYMATLPGGKKVHFGSPKYPDYTIHKDKERRDKYLSRATKIKNKQGELTYTNPESSNYWSVHLLWPEKKLIKDLIKYNKMSSNGIVGLTSLSNDIDLVSKKYVNSNYVDNNFKKGLIKVLEEGLKEISERLYSIEVTIENKNDLKE